MNAIAGRIVTVKPVAESLSTKRTDELAFLGPGPFDEAKAQLGGLASTYPANGFGYAAIARSAAAPAIGRDAVAAARAYGAMLAILPDDPAVWRDFAAAFLSQNPEDSGERQQAAQSASSAAINAYLRSTSAGDQVLALGLLGRSLEKREMWREAIRTYRFALTLREDKAIRTALGDKKGIRRYGSADLPMDGTLTRAAIDVSGRPFLVWKVAFTAPKIGEMDTELFREFFQAFAMNAGLTLHVETFYGDNNHHVAESCFKAVARALRQAVEIDPRAAGRIPSTKGSL